MTEADEITPSIDPGRTVAGVIGLVCAALSACCIPLGCITWLAAWYAVAPLAGLGLVWSVFGRGWVRIAATAVNVFLLLFGIGFYVALALSPR